MTQVYRFFPWVRSGLAGSIAQTAPTTRALSSFKVTVIAGQSVQRDVLLLGPGDVIGLDQRLIVRTDPRARTTNAEPNYLASVDFDTPDFPWMFTPADASGRRLQPWIALVVFDADAVGNPQISRDCPLPWLEIKDAAAKQLPDLADSWAWAHAQRLTSKGDTADAESLSAAPDLNVSRLICPRRLAPRTRYLACIVPAWEPGRLAGLGLLAASPIADNAALAPAWTPAKETKLPLYYHWEFSTGDAGDFETLARRLNPLKVSAEHVPEEAAHNGRVYLGGVDGLADTRAALPPADPASSIRIEAPLEALDRSPASVSETPPAFAAAVDRAISDDRPDQTLMPPIYGDRHARRDDVNVVGMDQTWLDELNLDPRTRLAARLGGDVVRKFQEQLMDLAWQQVGDVLGANAQLARSRFFATVAIRMLDRAAKLRPDRFLALTSCIQQRVLVNQLTVATRLARTSLPTRAFDPALRRMASPVGRAARLVARVAQHVRVNTNPGLARGLVTALQRDELAIDPGTKARDGIVELGMAKRAQLVGWNDMVVRDNPEVKFSTAELTGAVQTDLTLKPRENIARTGLFTQEHVRIARLIETDTGIAANDILDLAAQSMIENPDALQLGIRKPDRAGGRLHIDAIVEEGGQTFVAVDPAGAKTRLFTFDSTQNQIVTTTEIRTAIHNMPVVTQAHSGFVVSIKKEPAGDLINFVPVTIAGGGSHFDDHEIAIGPSVSDHLPGDVSAGPGLQVWRTVRGRDTFDLGSGGDAAPQEEHMYLDIMPPLERPQSTELVTSAYGDAFGKRPPKPHATLLRALIGDTMEEAGLARDVLAAIDPAVAFRARARMLVTVPDWLSPTLRDVLEPIAAAPVLDAAFADLFVQTSPERLLPGEVNIAENSIAALKTNPRFVAAFMVGANHEMNRELLWRTYPTDTRGTSITRFWNWFDPTRKDVVDLYHWPADGPLVDRGASGNVSQVAMIIRGHLLQRYPNTHLMVWKSKPNGGLAELPADPGQLHQVLRAPIFKLPIDPDITVAGFDITDVEFRTQPGWYLVLQEPVTEARFGLDENDDDRPGRPARRPDSRNWAETQVVPGGLLTTAALRLLNGDSAIVANQLLQRQVRFAVHSSELTTMFPRG